MEFLKKNGLIIIEGNGKDFIYTFTENTFGAIDDLKLVGIINKSENVLVYKEFAQEQVKELGDYEFVPMKDVHSQLSLELVPMLVDHYTERILRNVESRMNAIHEEVEALKSKFPFKKLSDSKEALLFSDIRYAYINKKTFYFEPSLTFFMMKRVSDYFISIENWTIDMAYSCLYGNVKEESFRGLVEVIDSSMNTLLNWTSSMYASVYGAEKLAKELTFLENVEDVSRGDLANDGTFLELNGDRYLYGGKSEIIRCSYSEETLYLEAKMATLEGQFTLDSLLRKIKNK